MKKFGARFYLLLSGFIWTAISVLRLVLELIGYATITEDAKEAHVIVRALADMALAVPWWAIWWPLMASYVFAAGIAFDFSFDLFKRDKNKIKVKGDAGKALQACQDFYSSLTKYKMRNGSIRYTSRYAVAGEAQILWKHLLSKGLVHDDLPELEHLAENIDDILLFVRQETGRIEPHLKRGDIKSAQAS